MNLNRINHLQQEMTKKGIDLMMLQSRSNVFYASGFDADPHERLIAVLLPADGDPFTVCPGMEKKQISALFDGAVYGYDDSTDPWTLLMQIIQEKKLPHETIALEETMAWARVQQWEQLAPGAALVSADPILLEARGKKTADERKAMEEAAALADFGVETGISALKEGVTEMEVIAAVEFALKKEGVREMSFSTMVLFGGGAGDPHGNPGNRKLAAGDGVLFDLGVRWKGYTSDITRTVFFRHADEQQRRIYETVQKAQEAAVRACRTGTRLGDIDTAARNVIEQAGWGDYFPHRIGHGIGIDVHEAPSMSSNNNDKLEAGLAFTIEPGIYLPDTLGVRIEDDIIMEEAGPVLLTAYPKTLQIV
nr:Xaa-Pro peptidase family protein [Alkalicoccus chagannorensis]